MSQKVTITVKEGRIRGFKTKSEYSGTEYYSFLGVPYGQSTAGQARFKDPVEVKPWTNVLDATVEKQGCVQFSYITKSLAGDEDCLYNNIHTTKIPSKEDNQLKAVIVNIHPGGLFHGSPDPSYFGSAKYVMNHDIVYVCIGYRIHILGHLNLNLKNCTGNQSLKDIILSLKWIKNNIHFFGGDPENVTLLGSSSGSAIIHDLLISPLAKGLYHKAIMMGLYVFNPTLITYGDHLDLAYEIAYGNGFEGTKEDTRKLLNFFKQTDIRYLVLSKIHRMNGLNDIKSRNGLPILPCSPFTPMYAPGKDSPLPLPTRELIPSTNRVPLMVGFCNKEGVMGLAISNKSKRPLSQYFQKILTQNIAGWGVDLTEDELKLVQKKVEDYYTNGKSIDTASEITKCDILTDASLADLYDSLINVVSSDPSSPVYVYNFEFDGNLISMRNETGEYLDVRMDGAFHAADYSYWCYFENQRTGLGTNIPPKERKMIDTMTNLLTTFAKTGNPNNDHLQVNWKPSFPENPCYLKINETLEVKDELLNGERMQFWRDLMQQFKKN